MEPKQITAKAIQDTALAALRILSVLIGGLTVLFGLVAKRDLAGLIVWVQSSDFLIFAGAAMSAGSLIWALWKTYSRSHQMNTAKSALEGTIQPMVDPAAPGDKFTHLSPLWAIPVLLAFAMVTGCATVGSVQLNAAKAFYTAQIAFKSAQQTTISVCAVPAPRLVAPCKTAIDLLHEGALAEAAGFSAQQAGNAKDLQTAIAKLTDLPPRLAALGILGN